MTSVRGIGPDGAVTVHPVDRLPALLDGDSWVWLDVPEPDESTAALLTDVLGIHPQAAADGLARNHIARLHQYADVLWLALHRPEPGAAGHVHYLELDAGRLRVTSPSALLYAIVSAVTNVQERIVNEFAQQVGVLEQRVMAQDDDDHPQEFLDELFTTRHTLLTVRTMASQGAEVLARAVTLTPDPRPEGRAHLEDLRDQYQRLARVIASQLEFLEGVTDFYRARTDTRMLIAAERLAVIAAITLPVAAISGVFGMNVIVNDRTHWPWLLGIVGVMVALSLVLLRLARRQGWW
jgi:Mg2+ and Co2+ transporter CorA